MAADSVTAGMTRSTFSPTNPNASRGRGVQVLYCNIGNPHSLGQKPITYYREVDPTPLPHPFRPLTAFPPSPLLSLLPSGSTQQSRSRAVRIAGEEDDDDDDATMMMDEDLQAL